MKRLLSLLLLSASLFAEGEKFVIGSFPHEGFFSSFLAVLSNARWAEKNGRTPVVYWTDINFYYQEEGYNGSKNPWEYYFEPISPLSYEPGDLTHNTGDAPDGSQVWDLFIKQDPAFDEFRKSVHDTIEKYIKVKPCIQEKVDAFYDAQMKGKKIVGIHIRGTDILKRREKEGMTKLQIDEANKVARTLGKKTVFFVATDEQALLDYAIAQLKGPVIYTDAHHSEDGSPIHVKSGLPGVERAKLGEEVLIDTLLLARCHHFVHTRSSVPLAVLYLNPTLPNTYLDPFHWLHRLEPPPQPPARR